MARAASADPTAPPSRRRMLDTSVALRALSIVFIVGSHVPNLPTIRGGAHLLIGVAGFNFARFHLDGTDEGTRSRRLWGAALSLAVPSVVWIALLYLLADDYRLSNVLLLNSILGPHNGPSEWHFWFIEALVYIFVAVATILTVPAVRRTHARFPFGFPMCLVVVGLIARYDLFGLRFGGFAPVAASVLWLFALGWAAARANTLWQRLLVTAAVVATTPGFFEAEPLRDALVMAGLVVLVWIPTLPSIASVNRLAGVLAGASLYIYLIHWQVYPRLDQYSRVLALIAALLAGIACAAATGFVRRHLSVHIRRVRRVGWRRPLI